MEMITEPNKYNIIALVIQVVKDSTCVRLCIWPRDKQANPVSFIISMGADTYAIMIFLQGQKYYNFNCKNLKSFTEMMIEPVKYIYIA